MFTKYFLYKLKFVSCVRQSSILAFYINKPAVCQNDLVNIIVQSYVLISSTSVPFLTLLNVKVRYNSIQKLRSLPPQLTKRRANIENIRYVQFSLKIYDFDYSLLKSVVLLLHDHTRPLFAILIQNLMRSLHGKRFTTLRTVQNCLQTVFTCFAT